MSETNGTPITAPPGTQPVADVIEVLAFLQQAMQAAKDAGNGTQHGCILIFVDAEKKWAAQTSGLNAEQIKDLLVVVRDNAVQGGSGFTVLSKAEPAANAETMQ